MPLEPHRDEHTSAAPSFSPGLVQSDEIILRTILDPDHLGPDGKVADAAISLTDIRSRGWSVDRKRFTSPWRIRWFHSDWKKRIPKIRQFYILPIPVKDIRYTDPKTGKQDFVVIDTAGWMHPAHADVLLSARQGEGAARGFRIQLIRKLPPYVEVARAFESTDKHGFTTGMFKQLLAILRTGFRTLSK